MCDDYGGCSQDGASPLTCVGGICYACGEVTDPPEPCCNYEVQSGGRCNHGACVADPQNPEYMTCEDKATENCAVGQQPNFFFYTLDATCEPEEHDFCAADQNAADAYVTGHYFDVAHGPAGTDPKLVAPTEYDMCIGTNNEGVCGWYSGQDQAPIAFYAFTTDQLYACGLTYLGDDQLGCDWYDAQGGGCY